MPVYEYVCNSCGKRFEISQSMLELPINVCPECKGNMKRVISGGSGFIMKSGSPVRRTQCGKTQTCCGSQTPCETPSCGHGE